MLTIDIASHRVLDQEYPRQLCVNVSVCQSIVYACVCVVVCICICVGKGGVPLHLHCVIIALMNWFSAE